MVRKVGKRCKKGLLLIGLVFVLVSWLGVTVGHVIDRASGVVSSHEVRKNRSD